MPLDDPGDGLLVRGVAICGYRSLNELQFIGPFRKINVLAGRNNSGKSNVLRFLRDHYDETVRQLARPNQKALAWADGEHRPLGSSGEEAAFGVCRDLRTEHVAELGMCSTHPTAADRGAQ